MRSKTINLKLSAQLVQKIDEAAKASYTSRSDFIRASIAMRLNSQLLVSNPEFKDIKDILEVLTKVDQSGY